MPGLSAPIVVREYILSLATIHADIETFFQTTGATLYALNFETSCRRRQNMPITLKLIVAENSTDIQIKYKILH